jgi:hypothetical protein
MAREPAEGEGSGAGARPVAPDAQPYITETVEIDDPDTWAREATNDVESYIATAEANADRVLEGLRQRRREWTAELLKTAVAIGLLTAEKAATLADVEPSAPLLAGDAKREDAAVHQAALVKLSAGRLRHAVASGDIQEAVRQAMHVATAVERAQHLGFWWPEVAARRRRDALDRSNIADHNARLHEEAAAFWAPWQAQYRELRAAGRNKTAARQEVGGRIVAETGQVKDDKTLGKWLVE